MKSEYIYALQNKSFGVHHIKIGKTTRKPDLRAKELYSGASGVPEPFDIAFACQVSDCEVAEKRIHERLKTYRTNRSREFFIIPLEVAKTVILSVCRQINRSSNCFIGNLVIIDSREFDESDQLLDNMEVEDLAGVVWLNSGDLLWNPPGTSTLSDEQKQRVEVISATFSSIDSDSAESWFEDFSRDMNPEKEISVWENIAKAFLKIDQVKYLSDDQKKEAFHLLLSRSMMSVGKVLERCKLSTLSKRQAKEILRGYEAESVPVSIRYQPPLQ